MVTNRLFILIISAAFFNLADAAPRDVGGNAKIVSKLQTMVNEITTERDRLKIENAKIAAELETLKGQVVQEQAKAASLEERLDSELSSQKASKDEVQGRLDNTMEKLREIIDKYNALNKAKNELAAEHTNLQNSQQFTISELKMCESKNIKMYEGTKEIIAGFHACQNRGVVDALIESEPFFQFKNVEFETIAQEYEDKLNKQKYQSQFATYPVSPESASQSAK
jgi:chromosome segregation ATPase